MNGSDPFLPEAESVGDIECLYRRFYARLVRHVVWRHRLSREDAMEVIQDVFVLALRRLDERGNPQAWLYSVADNLAANLRRKLDRRDRLRAAWSVELGSESSLSRRVVRQSGSED